MAEPRVVARCNQTDPGLLPALANRHGLIGDSSSSGGRNKGGAARYR